MNADPSRARARSRTVASDGQAATKGLIPPIQLGTSGDPISVTDSVVSAVLLALALAAISRLTGVNPTKLGK